MPQPSALRSQCQSPKVVALLLVLVGLVCLGVGILIGWKSTPEVHHDVHYDVHHDVHPDGAIVAMAKKLVKDGFVDDTEGIGAKILANMDVNRIKENFRLIVERPHIAGTDGDHQLASIIANLWKEQGLVDVELPAYDVLLSYPTEANTVELVGDSDGDVYYRGGGLTELDIMATEGWKNQPYPFPYLAYSTNGTVVGDPVFVNYGDGHDYRELQKLNVNVKGKIVIVKHGQMMCGKKISEAERRGAIGVLVYSDPGDVAQNGSTEDSVYPNSWSLPETGVARTSLRSYVGDPLTPGMPAKRALACPGRPLLNRDIGHYAYRIPENKTDIPRIPSHTISYKDAKEIMGRMGGPEASLDWIGGLGISYHVGPGFADEFKPLHLKFSVYNQRRRALSYNVVGFIYGDVEPDRYVILGNHRDAWVQGAVDPGSGTAVLLELTRVLGDLYQQGWRPRRTLVFCSWGAEEFGLIGSTEWVEDHLLKLQERTVAYINVDTCIIGDSFAPLMSYTLKDAAIRVAKQIPDADNSNETLYDTWYGKLKNLNRLDSRGEIPMQRLDLYSDFGAFLFFAGIPIMDVTWNYLENVGASVYPSYHTEFESIDYIEKFLDPHYRRHLGCAQFTAMMLHSLSNVALLPYTFDEYVYDTVYVMELITDTEEILDKYNISLSAINNSLHALKPAVAHWNSYVESADRTNPYVLRALNDHMMLMHKAFYTMVQTKKSDSWFYRYGYERSLYHIYDTLQDRDAGASKMDVVRQLLAQLTFMMDTLTNFLLARCRRHDRVHIIQPASILNPTGRETKNHEYLIELHDDFPTETGFDGKRDVCERSGPRKQNHVREQEQARRKRKLLQFLHQQQLF